LDNESNLLFGSEVKIFLFMFVIPSVVYGKAAKFPPATPAMTAVEFYQLYVEPVLSAVQRGNVSIADASCISPTYTTHADLVTATVSAQNFYLVLNPTSVETLKFNPSYCQLTKLANGASEIDCAATEIGPVNSPGSTLSFSMEYIQTDENPNTYKINRCPHHAQ
jgi:hypothetical protein